MKESPMKILIVEDDTVDCNNFMKTLRVRKEFELIAITDSDIEATKYVEYKRPEGIILDIELNNSTSGSTDALEFLDSLKRLDLGYQPIIVVTTHINSKRTYDILHRKGVDIILYKDNPTYSSDYVLNKLLTLREAITVDVDMSEKAELIEKEDIISNHIYHELDLIGITPKLKGREYAHDAILYLIMNPDSTVNVIQYLVDVYITNGIQNAIVHAWRVSSLEDLSIHYKAVVNYQTGVPTTMEFIYHYVDKIRKLI